MKKVLSIAGSDCSGGAGIQADLKTFAAHGVYGMCAVVAVVAQSTARVRDMQIMHPAIIEQQLDIVFNDMGTDAVKIGMLANCESIYAVSGKLKEYRPHNIIIDPVIRASDGTYLLNRDAVSCFIRHIVPLSDILTPNIPEAEQLSGIKIDSLKDIAEAARRIHAYGTRNVLIKGGHSSGDPCDVLYDGEEFYYYQGPRIPGKNVHGTGCTCSSAIAANRALGFSISESIKKAKEYITESIRYCIPVGTGACPAHHFYKYYLP